MALETTSKKATVYRIILSTCAATAGLALVGAPASAQAPSRPMVVKVNDLDLNRVSEAAIALDRVQAAARRYCGYASPTNLGFGAAIRACRDDVTGKAVAMLANPTVTALHESGLRPFRDTEDRVLARR